MSKLDKDVLSNIFVKHLSLKKKTKPYGSPENARIYRIFLINRSCYYAALCSLRHFPTLKIYDKRHFYMDLDFSDTLHTKVGVLPINLQFFDYFHQKYGSSINQLSISLQNRHKDGSEILEKVDFSDLKVIKCAIEGSEIVYGFNFAHILEQISRNLQFLAIDNKIFNLCPKLEVKEVSLKANDNNFDLDTARQIRSNCFSFLNFSSITYWAQLAEFFGISTTQEIRGNFIHLRTPSNQLFQFHFPQPEKHINPYVKRIFFKLEGRVPGPHLDDIFSDCMVIFPCLEQFVITITSFNVVNDTPPEFESVHEFLVLYQKCLNSIDSVDLDCKFAINIEVIYTYEFFKVQIPPEDFFKKMREQLQDFSLVKNSDDDISSLLGPSLNPETKRNVVTYQKEDKFYGRMHSLRGKVLIAYSA